MNRPQHWHRWPLGAISLVLAVLAWGGMAVGLLVFLSATGSPGDGDQPLRAAQPALLLAIGMLALSGLGSGVASVLAWRLQRGRGMAATAALLLALLGLVIILPVLASVRDPLLAGDAIWQPAGSRG